MFLCSCFFIVNKMMSWTQTQSRPLHSTPLTPSPSQIFSVLSTLCRMDVVNQVQTLHIRLLYIYIYISPVCCGLISCGFGLCSCFGSEFVCILPPGKASPCRPQEAAPTAGGGCPGGGHGETEGRGSPDRARFFMVVHMFVCLYHCVCVWEGGGCEADCGRFGNRSGCLGFPSLRHGVCRRPETKTHKHENISSPVRP